MSAPQSVLLARLANVLESARLEAQAETAWLTLVDIVKAQELLEQVRDA